MPVNTPPADLRDPPSRRWRGSASAIGAVAAGVALASVLAAAPAVGAAAAAAAAAVEERNSFDYVPPDKPPRGERSHYVEAPPEWLLEHMAAHLRQLGFKVEWRDAAKRGLVARFSGSPKDYVDCGVVQMLVDGKRPSDPKQYSADRPKTRTYRIHRGRRVGLLRELGLEARIAAAIEPEGKGSRVKTEAIYVLTKTISRIYKGGVAGEVLEREVMSFDSNEIGRFKKGTTCVATGRLEDLPVLPFRKQS